MRKTCRGIGASTLGSKRRPFAAQAPCTLMHGEGLVRVSAQKARSRGDQVGKRPREATGPPRFARLGGQRPDGD